MNLPDAELVENVWEQVLRAAEATAKQEPILTATFRERLLRHDSLSAALSDAFGGIVSSANDTQEFTSLARSLYEEQPVLVADAAADLTAFVARDPSCHGVLDAFMNYKGFKGLQSHRIAHALWLQGRTSLARFIQGRVAESFAMDFHPGAAIGRYVFIDHGTGIVIGETAVVENNVSMLHSVTLGGTGKVAGDRHPKVREGVMIGAGAKLLGNIEIGGFSKIAAGSVVLRSVPPHSTAAGVPAQIVGQPREDQPYLEMHQDIG